MGGEFYLPTPGEFYLPIHGTFSLPFPELTIISYSTNVQGNGSEYAKIWTILIAAPGTGRRSIMFSEVRGSP